MKLITEALKDIRKWETVMGRDDKNIKFWLGQLYRQGLIDGLEKAMEIRKKVNQKYETK